MCGIVGMLGKSDVAFRLLEGLEKLEYRGYDSAGIGVMEQSRVNVSRAAGKLENLRSEVSTEKTRGVNWRLRSRQAWRYLVFLAFSCISSTFFANLPL